MPRVRRGAPVRAASTLLTAAVTLDLICAAPAAAQSEDERSFVSRTVATLCRVLETGLCASRQGLDERRVAVPIQDRPRFREPLGDLPAPPRVRRRLYSGCGRVCFYVLRREPRPDRADGSGSVPGHAGRGGRAITSQGTSMARSASTVTVSACIAALSVPPACATLSDTAVGAGIGAAARDARTGVIPGQRPLQRSTFSGAKAHQAAGADAPRICGARRPVDPPPPVTERPRRTWGLADLRRVLRRCPALVARKRSGPPVQDLDPDRSLVIERPFPAQPPRTELGMGDTHHMNLGA